MIDVSFGIGGPYEAFGGRDASRALARFAVDAATDKYDDLSDLNTTEMNSIKEWEEQFKGEQINVFQMNDDSFVNSKTKELDKGSYFATLH